MSSLLSIATQAYQDTTSYPSYPDFRPGDTICVHVKIKEGSKERTQRFEGVVIQIKGDTPANRTFTVRKVSSGVGVERIFPFLTPTIHKIELVRYGKVRRARLFYLRGKQGKAAKVKEDTKRKYATKAN